MKNNKKSLSKFAKIPMSKQNTKSNSKAKVSKSNPKSPKTKSAKTQQQDSWPERRDVFFRSQRAEYVKKPRELREENNQCVFCLSADHGVGFERLCLYKNNWVQVVMNKFPYNGGHLLVLPVAHKGDITDLDPFESQELMRLVQASVDILKQVYEPQAFNIGMNMGAEAGAGIPGHLHFHVIPRWAGDTNFFPLIAKTKVVIEDLEQTYEKLSHLFEKIG